MYNRNNRNRNSYSRSRFSGRRGRSSYGHSRGRNTKTFDPSIFIKEAVSQEEEIYTSRNQFSDFNIHEQLKKTISARGYMTPTPIQDQAIPVLLEGRDVVGIANTGTGKTAAFLIPLINKLFYDRSQSVLIITPTRELAVQIRDEFQQFAYGTDLSSALCIGGVGINPQIARLRRNPHFVIGTPGRLKDLEQKRALRLDTFENIVLDEVDRMLDMGFIHDITYLISRLPKERHSLFFSATMAPNVKNVMSGFLKNPSVISVKTKDASSNVDQDVIKIKGRDKIDVLHELLETEGFDRVLVFGRTKHGTEKVARELHRRRVAVASIHGNKSQSQRQRAIDDFKSNRVQVLLATDVASRGLDIQDVTHVINYDLPETYEDYIHRIGRTGRANKKGIALTFID